VSSNSKDIDGVTLIVQGENRVLVDIVRSDDRQAREPVDVEGLGDADERLPSNLRQVGEIAGVNPDSQSSVAEVVQGHGHGREVQKATPRILGKKFC
jgi:hypothetical protein